MDKDKEEKEPPKPSPVDRRLALNTEKAKAFIEGFKGVN